MVDSKITFPKNVITSGSINDSLIKLLSLFYYGKTSIKDLNPTAKFLKDLQKMIGN